MTAANSTVGSLGYRQHHRAVAQQNVNHPNIQFHQSGPGNNLQNSTGTNGGQLMSGGHKNPQN